MLSNRPYLLRAFYEWIVDSQCHPILVINANYPKVKIPNGFVEDGEFVLDVSSQAVKDLKITNQLVELKASFSGVVHLISAPIQSILALYADENNEGIFFDSEEEMNSDFQNDINELERVQHQSYEDAEALKAAKKPFLRLVE